TAKPTCLTSRKTQTPRPIDLVCRGASIPNDISLCCHGLTADLGFPQCVGWRRTGGGSARRMAGRRHAVAHFPPYKRRFQLILIKPSHYDDDGYVIRWWRAITPSNSLAAVYGIAADSARREALGRDTAIDIEPVDETHPPLNIPPPLAAPHS